MATRTTLNVSLPIELGRFIESSVNSGRYSSASEVVRAALRCLAEREQKDSAAFAGADSIENSKERVVLIVEDEPLLAIDLEDRLAQLGYRVAARASDVASGLAAARKTACDIAVLDVNLAGQDSGPIADILISRNIPVVFASGYTEAGLPARHKTCPLVAKPYEAATLGRALIAAYEAANGKPTK